MIYRGFREKNLREFLHTFIETPVVMKDEVVLDSPISDISENIHVPFEWGCATCFATEHLSYAILADWSGTHEINRSIIRKFSEDVISKLPYSDWTLTEDEITKWASKTVQQDDELPEKVTSLQEQK